MLTTQPRERQRSKRIGTGLSVTNRLGIGGSEYPSIEPWVLPLWPPLWTPTEPSTGQREVLWTERSDLLSGTWDIFATCGLWGCENKRRWNPAKWPTPPVAGRVWWSPEFPSWTLPEQGTGSVDLGLEWASIFCWVLEPGTTGCRSPEMTELTLFL